MCFGDLGNDQICRRASTGSDDGLATAVTGTICTAVAIGQVLHAIG